MNMLFAEMFSLIFVLFCLISPALCVEFTAADLPAGEYRDTCQGCAMVSGLDILHCAVCNTAVGERVVPEPVFVNSCLHFVNNNGKLVCLERDKVARDTNKDDSVQRIPSPQGSYENECSECAVFVPATMPGLHLMSCGACKTGNSQETIPSMRNIYGCTNVGCENGNLVCLEQMVGATFKPRPSDNEL